MNKYDLVIKALKKSTDAKMLDVCNTDRAECLLINDEGMLHPVPAKELALISHQELQNFCHGRGIYSLPTTELIDFIKTLIPNPDTAIEIGAGNGVYGRALNIIMTDNYMQHIKNNRKFRGVIEAYVMAGQPLVEYEDDVKEIDGMDAVIKFNPETILMSWVTHKYNKGKPELSGNMYGVDMLKLAKRKSVKRIILIGNEAVHSLSPLMSLPHDTFELPDIQFSRASKPQLDRVYVWDL